MVGDELRIYVEVAGQPGEKFSFQWSCNGKNLPYVTSNVLYQKQVKLEDQGSYFCRIRSEQGGSSLTDGTQVIGEQKLVSYYNKLCLTAKISWFWLTAVLWRAFVSYCSISILLKVDA